MSCDRGWKAPHSNWVPFGSQASHCKLPLEPAEMQLISWFGPASTQDELWIGRERSSAWSWSVLIRLKCNCRNRFGVKTGLCLDHSATSEFLIESTRSTGLHQSHLCLTQRVCYSRMILLETVWISYNHWTSHSSWTQLRVLGGNYFGRVPACTWLSPRT